MARTLIVPQFPQVERPYAWNTYKVTVNGDDLTGNPSVVIDTLPIGSTLVDAKVMVTEAEAGSTAPAAGLTVAGEANVVASIDLSAAPELFLAASTTVLADASVALLGAEGAISLEITRTGTGTTPPVVYVHVLVGRVEQ